MWDLRHWLTENPVIHCMEHKNLLWIGSEVPYHCPVFPILLPHSSLALLVPTQRGLRQLKWLSSVTYPPFAQVGLGSPFLLWKLCKFPSQVLFLAFILPLISSLLRANAQACGLLDLRRKRVWWEFYWLHRCFPNAGNLNTDNFEWISEIW